LKKHTFLKSYRFCLAYENESTPGYTTEKLLHAKAAGCVPIYWGDPKVGRDFDIKGFLNVTSEEELVALVDAVESDTTGEKWTKLASVPALSTYSRDLVRRTFSELVKRLLTVSGKQELTKSVPPFIGAKTSAEADAMRAKRVVPAKDFLFVTGTTQRFWPFLLMWLDSIQHHRTVNSAIKARVYVGADVSESSLVMTRDKYSFAEFIRFPKEYPGEFTDFWDPKHFAWKLWIYKTVANDPSLHGSMAFYMDTASVLVRWPSEWIECAQQHGLSFLEDSTQINRHWCHKAFCDALSVSPEELDSNQIIAGLCVFVPGHPKAVGLFNDAYELACTKHIIAGDKWSGIGADGKPYGHRHDQSILSILSLRLPQHRFPLEKVYGEISAKTTLLNGQSVYVHRGSFKSHIPFLPGIDDALVINLTRREDRRRDFLTAHPYLKGRIKRIEAFDGKTLSLTPTLASLLKVNDFFWKKAVAGCALSHMSAWNLLASQPIDVNAFLIMEDDARLHNGWEDAWRKVYPRLPDEWDCVYLGGVLPPNRPGFAMNLERIAEGLARVSPNRVFGQAEPTRYFHFCAYAYVLSKKGAEKILQSIIDKGGYWTSADHMICNRTDMNLYVLDPLVAGASQDSDPAYQTSQFNDFSRVDGFDSDLWNNDERFTGEEIAQCLSKNAPLSINDALVEARMAQAAALPLSAAVPAAIPAPIPAVVPAAVPTVVATPIPAVVHEGPRFVCLKQCKLTNTSIYESKWLQDLLPSKFQIEQVCAQEDLSANTTVVLIKPLWDEQLNWLTTLKAKGRPFKIIHLSDEFASDPIEMYEWPEVTGVLRFYTRPDCPVDPKILTVPLGYHRQFPGNRDVPHMSTPELPFREFTWSFAGTNWKGRSQDMQILDAIQPRHVTWYSDWNDAGQMKSDEYISLLLNSIFVPCPKGQNIETYRFYEALDAGCIPLCIDIPPSLEGKLPLLNLESWNHAAALMQHFMQNKEQLEQYRIAVLVSWTKLKMELKEKVRQWAS
jgi:GR25 family glycosyltransferase involved in LPS biosynthesis